MFKYLNFILERTWTGTWNEVWGAKKENIDDYVICHFSILVHKNYTILKYSSTKVVLYAMVVFYSLLLRLGLGVKEWGNWGILCPGPGWSLINIWDKTLELELENVELEWIIIYHFCFGCVASIKRELLEVCCLVTPCDCVSTRPEAVFTALI
jgi:hypothetical protein